MSCLIGRTQCWIELSTQVRWQIYMCLVATALFVLPAIIIAACYAIIVRTIWAKGALIMTTGKKGHTFYFEEKTPYNLSFYINLERSRGGIDRGSRRASSRGIIPRAKIKTVKMTIVIVIGRVHRNIFVRKCIQFNCYTLFCQYERSIYNLLVTVHSL